MCLQQKYVNKYMKYKILMTRLKSIHVDYLWRYKASKLFYLNIFILKEICMIFTAFTYFQKKHECDKP